jgi:hypothetical protein
MENKVIYYERQRFNQWWLWTLLGGINLLFATGCVRQLFMGIPFGSRPMSNGALLLSAAIVFLTALLLFSLKLHTCICTEGIIVRFSLFPASRKHFPWEEIDRLYIRKYHPLKDYLGWGYRIRSKNRKAYNVSGNTGLQIILKNGKEFLIGTNDPERMAEALTQLGRM